MVAEGLNLSWWITAVEIPLFSGLFFMVRNQIHILERSLKEQKEKESQDVLNIIKSISDFKVNVAINYASISYIKDVENRLTSHLLRIEEKISIGGV